MLVHSNDPRRADLRNRAAACVVVLLFVFISACGDGALFTPNSTGPTRLGLRPYFSALDGGSTSIAEINRIRLTVKQQPEGTTLQQNVFDVDPAQSAWNLDLEVPPNTQLEILIELINVGPGNVESVEYSGKVEVTVTSGPQPDPAPVPVYPGPPENLTVTSVTIAPRDQDLLEGDNVSLHAVVAGSGNATVVWTSDDPGVASVDENGQVTAIAPGHAVIRASAGPRSDNISVAVTARATRIDITPADPTVTSFGTDVSFSGVVRDVRNNEVTGLPIAWEIADGEIATQIAPGVFRARRNGTTTVTATTVQRGQTITSSATLKVEQQAVTLSIDPASAEFTAYGETRSFTAAATDANGNAVSGLDFDWSSSNESVATVDAEGVVTAVANGSATIRAALGSTVAEAHVTVAQAPASVTVTPDRATLRALDATVQLQAAAKDARGNVIDVPITWTSSIPFIAQVDDHGLVTAVGDGTAVITAVAGNRRASATIRVDRTVARVELNESSLHLDAGHSFQLQAKPVDANGFEVPNNPVEWTSSDESVASVSASGLVAAHAEGTATITAHSAGKTGSAQVTVTGAAPGNVHVEILPEAVQPYAENCIPFGDNVQYHFSGFMYRNIEPFTVSPGDKIAFDMAYPNNVEIRRNIFLANANMNPPPAVVSGNNLVSQGVRALSWTKVVSESQTPENPFGNYVIGDYELVYTAESSFTFNGGGLIIGFSGTPEAQYIDSGCDQVLAWTHHDDPSNKFYGRFFFYPDQSLEVLDGLLHGGSGSADWLGGVKIYTPDPFVPQQDRPVTIVPPVTRRPAAASPFDLRIPMPDGTVRIVSRPAPDVR